MKRIPSVSFRVVPWQKIEYGKVINLLVNCYFESFVVKQNWGYEWVTLVFRTT